MIAVFCCGCVPSQQVSIKDRSDCLEDYSILVNGDGGEAQHSYIKKGVKWATYDKVLLDPVTLWRGYQSRFRGISPSDAQKLVDYFYNLAYAKLARNYKMVRQPVPHTLRVSIAIIKIDDSNVALNVISNVMPQARLKLKNIVTGKPSFMGKIAIELKLVDAQTGELLGIGVDRRVSRKMLDQRSLNSWDNIEKIMKVWVGKFNYRFCKGLGDRDCVL